MGRLGRIGWLLLGLALASVSLGFGPPRLVESDHPSLPVYQVDLRRFARPPAPSLTARAAVVMDVATGRVVHEQQGSARRAPASTTKIMTAIVALERGRIEDRFPVKAALLRQLDGTGSSLMGLRPGDAASLEDLLYGLMLPSGNDAALVIAEGLAGSVEGFVEWMNGKAAELGLRDTHFANPHGLDEPEHYSSAHDLAELGRYAMQNPTFRQIVGARSWQANVGRPLPLGNVNRFISRNVAPGFDGIKTGLTDDAGLCLVASVNREGRRVIAVVLGSKDYVTDTTRLVDYAYNTFVWAPLRGPSWSSFLDEAEATWEVEPAGPPAAMLARWQLPYLRPSARLDRHAGPFQPGERVGSLAFAIGPDPLVERPLMIRE